MLHLEVAPSDDENLNVATRTKMTDGNVPGYRDFCSPAWSHDGTKLAVSGYEPSNDQYDILLIDVNDRLVVDNITNTSDAYELYATFSPDDSQILYHRHTGTLPACVDVP